MGVDEARLPVNYSDVDYALKLRAAGLKILCTPEITAYHHESKSRGLDHLDPEKRARDAAERAVMEQRWGAAMAADPSVNPVWHMATLPFRLLSPPSRSRLWAHIERCAAEVDLSRAYGPYRGVLRLDQWRQLIEDFSRQGKNAFQRPKSPLNVENMRQISNLKTMWPSLPAAE
jgi:hypothetical protein